MPFDDIYTKFMSSGKTAENLLAYALFKEHEMICISSFKEENGNDPSEKELEMLMKLPVDYLNNPLNFYIEKANKLKVQWLGQEVDNKVNREISSWKRKLPSNWKSFCFNIIGSIVGSVGFYFLLTLLIIGIRLHFDDQYKSVGDMLKIWLQF